jgi:hypothetical protein
MLIQLRNLAVALLALAFPSVAFAAGAGAGATPDLTPISDAVTSGVTQGIEVMLAIAPIVIAFAVVWGVINKSRRMAK